MTTNSALDNMLNESKQLISQKIDKIIRKSREKVSKSFDKSLSPNNSFVISKTLVRDKVHDPITGHIKQYSVPRNRPLSLGNKKPIVISGKINDHSPPRTAYISYRDDKPKQKPINPLTMQTKESFHKRSVSSALENTSFVPKSSSSVSSARQEFKDSPNYEARSPSPSNELNYSLNAVKILKGQGIHFQKSNIF